MYRWKTLPDQGEARTISIDLLLRLSGLASLLAAFIYYAGRQYTDSYYEATGIPPSALHFDFEYYVYRGVSSLMFVAAVAAVGLILVLWKVLLASPRRSSHEGWCWSRLWALVKATFCPGKGAPSLFALWLFLYFLYGCTLVYVIVSSFGERNMAAEGAVGLIMGGFPAILGFLLIVEPPTMRFVREMSLLYWSFVLAIVISAFLVVHLVPASAGTFKGLLDSSQERAANVFPTVSLTATEPVGPPDLRWEANTDGSWTTSEPVLLVLQTDAHLFLRSPDERANTYYIPLNDIQAIAVHFTGRWYEPGSHPDSVG